MSPFESLLDDLAALRDRRQIEANARAARTVRENASRAARQAHESARNRRLQQMQQQPRRLMKSEPPAPAPAPDWNGLAARQDKIAADLEQTRIEQQKDAIRAHLATLAAAAKAGRLTAHQACLLDVYRGQALAMGLQP